MLGKRSPSRRTPPTKDHLIGVLIDMKWSELDTFAEVLRPSLRSAKGVDPARWVAHLATLANLDDLSRSLDGDYRRLASADSVPQRVRRAR